MENPVTLRPASSTIVADTPAAGVNVLVIYAHPEPTSFAAALKNVALSALTAAGHKVEVSDLYAEGFNPVTGRHDFTNAADPARFQARTDPARRSPRSIRPLRSSRRCSRVSDVDRRS